MDSFLLESGDHLLLESGDFLLLERPPINPQLASFGRTVIVQADERDVRVWPIDPA